MVRFYHLDAALIKCKQYKEDYGAKIEIKNINKY